MLVYVYVCVREREERGEKGGAEQVCVREGEEGGRGV